MTSLEDKSAQPQPAPPAADLHVPSHSERRAEQRRLRKGLAAGAGGLAAEASFSSVSSRGTNASLRAERCFFFFFITLKPRVE